MTQSFARPPTALPSRPQTSRGCANAVNCTHSKHKCIKQTHEIPIYTFMNITFSRERLAHRWPSIARGAKLARPSRRANYHRALRSGKLIPQNELRRSEGSGMLIGDPLSEGSNTSSTNSELWRAENSFERELKRSGVVPKAQAGAWPTQIRVRSCARNPTLRDF